MAEAAVAGGVWEVQGHMMVGRGAAGVVVVRCLIWFLSMRRFHPHPIPPTTTSTAVVLPLRKRVLRGSTMSKGSDLFYEPF